MSLESWLASIEIPPLHELLSHELLVNLASPTSKSIQASPDTPHRPRKRPYLNLTGAVMDSEMETTPRPRKRLRDALPPASLASSASSSVSTSMSCMTTSSRKSGQLSPSKQIVILEQDNMVFRDFGGEDLVVGDSVTRLWSTLQDVADGMEILEHDPLPTHDAHPLITPLDRRRLARPHIFTKSSGDMGVVHYRTVADLVAAACRCSDVDEGEAAWNEEVHRPVLRAALDASPFADQIGLETLKGASIEPRLLGPTALPKRVIDYAYTLRPSILLQTTWESLSGLQDNPIKSWNQTTFNSVRKTPLAISIETKSAQQSWTEGIPQVAIWTRALFRRLHALPRQLGSLNSPELQIPAVPVVIVQGHDWYFCLIIDSCLCEGVKRTVFLRSIPLGSTRSVFDAYKVMAALQKLIRWAQLEWRPWFESILTP